ncbi:AMP-binding protein [Yunchengibacter salinarum]|uniref:AMP-binding protein n=1 Tax=Yunchengibacter salinarum TaxID=3133399 RepID=UPI0035B69BBC
MTETDQTFTMGAFSDDHLIAEHLGDLVDNCVDRHGDRPAFSCVLPNGANATLTFRELGALTDAVAVYLREGLHLSPGDVVAIQAPNALAYPVVAFGVLKAGLTLTNVNPLYTPEETNHQLKDSGARILFVIDLFADTVGEAVAGTKVEKVFRLSLVDFFPALKRHALGFALKHVKRMVPNFDVDVHADMREVIRKGRRYLDSGVNPVNYRRGQSRDHPAFFQYTGGTTGRSKGASLSHYNVAANVSQGHLRNSTVMREAQETMMLVLPLYHVFALAVGGMASMHHGTHVILVPSPRPLANLRPVFDRFDITTMPGVNTLYMGLMQEDWFARNPPQNLRFCFAGAAPLNQDTARRWEALTGAPIYEGYGLTESTCVVTSMPLDGPPKKGTCGKPMPGTELRIVDDAGNALPPGEAGEVWVRGPQVMQGYLNRPEATAETIEDGWLKTGDIGVIDDEGYLSIVDRKKDMILVSGFNVYPADVEDVIVNMDGVSEAAVVGAPDDESGERVVAYVVPRGDSLTAEDVKAHCREHLTGYKRPKVVFLVDELPKSPVGKVLRKDLRQRARDEATG